MSPRKSPTDFVGTLKELEILVNRLEDNNTPLEQSLREFESGIQLIRQAQKALQEAEQKVQMLLDNAGDPAEAPLVTNEVGGDE